MDTDQLAPTEFLNDGPEVYSRHSLERIRPDLAERVREGDVILAGEDFGRGSSREHAALALKYLGIRAVIAVSIAPIMKRNLFNIGLPSYEDADLTRACSDGDDVEIRDSTFIDLTKDFKSPLKELPSFMLNIIEHGGLFEMLLSKGGLSSGSKQIEEEIEPREVGNTKVYPAYDKYVDVIVDKLEKGEVLCGPFDTTYGLFASIKRPDAVRRVYELKKRNEEMPLTMIVPRQRFYKYAEIPEKVQKLLDDELVGPISIILPKKKDQVPDYVTSGLETVSLADGENAFMSRIMERIEICGTSANISGMPPPSTLTGALKQIGGELTLAVDGGPTLYRIGHTVLDLSKEPPELIRAGPYQTKKLLQLFPELIGEQDDGLTKDNTKGRSIIDISPEVDIRASDKGKG